MKDKKFIILLAFMTIIALVNVVWLISLQATVNRTLRVNVIEEAEKFVEGIENYVKAMKNFRAEAIITDPFFIKDLTVRHLKVVNENLEERILMTAKQDNVGIYLVEQNRNIRISMEARGPGKNAAISVFLEGKNSASKHKKHYPGIHLTTLPELNSSTLLISGNQGQETTVVPFGVFTYNQQGELIGTLK